jgi:hypothetical protein
MNNGIYQLVTNGSQDLMLMTPLTIAMRDAFRQRRDQYRIGRITVPRMVATATDP